MTKANYDRRGKNTIHTKPAVVERKVVLQCETIFKILDKGLIEYNVK